jgi:hypothetical protein
MEKTWTQKRQGISCIAEQFVSFTAFLYLFRHINQNSMCLIVHHTSTGPFIENMFENCS